MPVPIICADALVCQFVQVFHPCTSPPQFQYFVTVLLTLLLCLEAKTLAALHRAVVAQRAYCGLSRFLTQAPWQPTAVTAAATAHFRQQLAPQVQADVARQRAARPRRRGRPAVALVTGYLIGDDSTMPKPKGRKMAALGRHYSSTVGHPVVGHSLFTCLYVLLGRQCPQEPQLYRQKAVAAAEGVVFRSKIDLLVDQITRFVPVAGTRTHVLADSWFGCKAVWRAARQRGFAVPTGLKNNRQVRVADAAAPGGWSWQLLSEYAAALRTEDYQATAWPGRAAEAPPVYVHCVTTRIRTLYKAQVVLVRERLDGPESAVRYWATSEATASVEQVLAHIAARWAIEVLFADSKELLGLDQYQGMSAEGVVRYWTLALVAYQLLEEQRARMQHQQTAPVSLGDARRALQRQHWRHLISWLGEQFQQGTSCEQLHQLLAA